MLIPDANLLIYAFNASAPLHLKARRWWEKEVNEGTALGIPWPVFQAFLRLLTSPSVVVRPYSSAEIFKLSDEWWSRPNIALLEPSRLTYSHFRRLVERYELAGSITTDALIAAFVIEHKARLASNDTDFLRFEEIKVLNPFLEAKPKAQ